MSPKNLKIVPLMILLYALQASVALPNATGPADDSPLLLDGKVVTNEQFAHVTRGVLTLKTLDPVSEHQKAIPFLIYLRRAGKIVNAHAHAHNHPVVRYEIAEILKSAQAGDELVIDPAAPSDAAARKVIIVKRTQIVPQFQWFYVLKPKKDNC